jgi:hypothetical protein
VKKADLKLIVDGLLFVSTVGVVLIGLLLGFVIPGGPAVSGEAKYLLGLHRHAWGDIHLYLGITFAAFAALHLVLGWSWIKGKARQLFQWRWTVAMASMPVLALLVVLILWAVSPRDGLRHTDQAGVAGRGRRVSQEEKARSRRSTHGPPPTRALTAMFWPASRPSPWRSRRSAHALRQGRVRRMSGDGRSAAVGTPRVRRAW